MDSATTTFIALALIYLMVALGSYCRLRDSRGDLKAAGIDPLVSRGILSCLLWPALLGYAIGKFLDTPSSYDLQKAELDRLQVGLKKGDADER